METINRLKEASESFTFTTDLIVGFPGETEYDFRESLEVMEEVRFSKVHMFPYSDRPRTRANLYPNKVSPDVIARRKQQVLRQAERDAFKLRECYVGQTMSVLTESRENDEWITGHTENFLEVKIPSKALMPNEIVTVTLKENHPKGFVGKLA